jgi:hypothetical protein
VLNEQKKSSVVFWAVALKSPQKHPDFSSEHCQSFPQEVKEIVWEIPKMK